MPRDATETRSRILATAAKLFSYVGIRSVGVDEIAARAGVTKRTLYYHFRSKDDLIAAYLAGRDQPTLDYIVGWMDAVDGPFSEQITAVFRETAKLARHPRWRGCGFLRTAAELASTPGHPALQACAAHKKKVEAEFARRLEADGIGDAGLRARQIMLLFDGAFSTMQVHRDPAYAQAAGAAAAMLAQAAPRKRCRTS